MPLVVWVVDAVCCLLTAVRLDCCVDETGAAVAGSKVERLRSAATAAAA